MTRRPRRGFRPCARCGQRVTSPRPAAQFCSRRCAHLVGQAAAIAAHQRHAGERRALRSANYRAGYKVGFGVADERCRRWLEQHPVNRWLRGAVAGPMRGAA
jgi:hypothetical protein